MCDQLDDNGVDIATKKSEVITVDSDSGDDDVIFEKKPRRKPRLVIVPSSGTHSSTRQEIVPKLRPLQHSWGLNN